MTYLLDVNVLIALIDPAHSHHETAHDWFAANGSNGWATCALTENGVIRILGNPNYPNSPGPPAIVAPIVNELKYLPGYQFWREAISLLDESYFQTHRILASKHITDTYLLGLAKRYNGVLATFDRRISTNAVIDGKNALHVIGN